MKNRLKILPLIFLVIPLCSISEFRPYANEKLTLGIFEDTSVEKIHEYYSKLSNALSGEDLLIALQPLLKNKQTKLSSSAVKNSNWKYFLLADRDFEKDPLSEEEIIKQTWKLDNVICHPLYEDKFIFIKENKPGDFINREHVFPKSYGFADENGDYAPFAGSDLHNLIMGERNGNVEGHSNYPYGNVDKSKKFSEIKSSISGKVTGYLGYNKNNIQVYEPRDKDKGNIARTLFYMAARYHSYDATVTNSPSLRLSDNPSDCYDNKKSIYAEETKNSPAQYGILSDLLKWNVLDPVDDYEIHRNNLVYNAIQHNRNPFIDYPEWADIAFGKTNEKINLNACPTQVGVEHKYEPGKQEDVVVDPTNPDNPKKDLNARPILAIICAIIILVLVILVTKFFKKNLRRGRKK